MPGYSSPGSTLVIAGGTYVERCQMPHWSELFGSGARAACALAGRGANILLHTYVTDQQQVMLAGIGDSLGFSIEPSRSPGTFEFDYRHSLARPSFWATHKDVYSLEPLRLSGEAVLAFGMMEGNPVVDGERVVYDPQSPTDAVPFDQNASRGEHLALVLNNSEARKLSGEDDVEAAGSKLLETAEVVVIKSGPQGVFVFTGSKMHRVPSYRTKRVFPIGSGDIFSAAFAYAWAVLRKGPEEAANIASLSTAYYVQSATLPIPKALPTDFHRGPVPAGRTTRVYLAGPFFSPQQLWMVDETRSFLTQQGAEVFSPYHDVGLGPASVVAMADLEALRACDSVLALLDGYDPGTLFEVGYARAIGKPVTVFVASADPVHLTMFSGSGCEVHHDFASAIYGSIWS